MTKLLQFLCLFGLLLVCFDKGDSFCVNPEHVQAVIKGSKGTMIILRDGELVTNEDFNIVVKKLRN